MDTIEFGHAFSGQWKNHMIKESVRKSWNRGNADGIMNFRRRLPLVDSVMFLLEAARATPAEHHGYPWSKGKSKILPMILAVPNQGLGYATSNHGACCISGYTILVRSLKNGENRIDSNKK